MGAQNQTQVPLAAQGTRKHTKRRFIIAAIIIAALIIAIVLALSSLGIIPGYLAIIISAFAIVFGVVFTLLPLILTDDKPVAAASSLPQYVMPEIKPEIHIEVHTPVPSVMPAPTSRQETTQSASAWNVPYLRNPFFTGRDRARRAAQATPRQSHTKQSRGLDASPGQA